MYRHLAALWRDDVTCDDVAMATPRCCRSADSDVTVSEFVSRHNARLSPVRGYQFRI